MPASASRPISVVHDRNQIEDIHRSLANVNNVRELREIMPTLVRDDLGRLCDELYRVATKSSHVEHQIADLRRHKDNDDFPPAIRAVKPLTIQVSKEYSDSSSFSIYKRQLEEAASEYQSLLLNKQIEVKTAELHTLQSALAPINYEAKAKALRTRLSQAILPHLEHTSTSNVEVSMTERDDGTVQPPQTLSKEAVTELRKEHAMAVESLSDKLLFAFPRRAIILAWHHTQRDLNRKMDKISIANKKKEEQVNAPPSVGASNAQVIADQVRRQVQSVLDKQKQPKRKGPTPARKEPPKKAKKDKNNGKKGKGRAAGRSKK